MDKILFISINTEWSDIMSKFKYVILTKKTFLTTITVTVAIVLTTILSVSAKTNNRKLPIYCVEKEEKVIALSFDAAWGNDDTEHLIEILAKYNAPATFFVVGEWVDKYPESVKQLADAGHQIQNHSATHPHMPNLSTEKMIEQLRVCNEKINAVTGQTPTLFRCPYGDYNNAVISAVESIGMYTIQWNIDSKDWMDGHTADIITNDVLSKVKPGSIVLFHNDADHTPEALPTILEKLSNDGYKFVFISDLIYKDNYEIKHDGTQSKIKDGAN